MNMATNTTIAKPTAAEIQVRIDDERRRLLTEQNLAVSLESQRLAPLEAGDDEALDRVEAQIAQCIDRQTRIQERLEILARRHAAALDTEKSAELDAVAARANAARELGEKLIRTDYAKQARGLAATLKRLALIDATIESLNRQLERGNRARVANSNQIRSRASERIIWRQKAQVGTGDPQHPSHGNVTHRSTDGKIAYLKNGGQCDAFAEVEVEKTELISGDHPLPLYEEVSLPRSEPIPGVHKSRPGVTVPPNYFEAIRYFDFSPEEVDALLAELSGSSASLKTCK